MKIAPLPLTMIAAALWTASLLAGMAGAQTASTEARFEVTSSAFGAAGDESKDDTATIQAAFNACWKNGQPGQGGVVRFPGPHTYLVSATINAYDGCQIEGSVGLHAGGYAPAEIKWNGPAAGAVVNFSGFTNKSNAAPYLSSPAFPLMTGSAIQNRVAPYVTTFTGANHLSAGQWVDIEGLSTSAGMALNRGIFQVAAATPTEFTVEMTFKPPVMGLVSDAGTATTVNVTLAFDAAGHFEESISNIAFGTRDPNNPPDVGIYFGSRVDTGTRIWNTWVDAALKYGYYFSVGGINVDFDKGWRSDGARIAGIYWRVGGVDSLGIANGTVDNHLWCPHCAPGTTSGAAVMLDNRSSGPNGGMHFTSRNIKVEDNTSLGEGLGVFTLLDNPANGNVEQFFLDFENTWIAGPWNTAGFNSTGILMSPPDDAALVLNIANSQFPAQSPPGTAKPFVGIPALSRYNMQGSAGWIPMLSYAPSILSGGVLPLATSSATQLMGDVNLGGPLYQYGKPASDLLETDSAFTHLPNATTVYAGQVIAPWQYWYGQGGQRYSLQNVSITGTTGAPNDGKTTCTGAAGETFITCSSAADLSMGQAINLGTELHLHIRNIDATNPNAVRVNLSSRLATAHSTPAALLFQPPQLGPEMQLPTKAASIAAINKLAWSQGDIEQNSAAMANEVAAWVNVSAGTPGSWAGIPLGDSNGKIAASQLARSSTVGSGKIVLEDQPTVKGLTGTGATTLTDLTVKGRCIGCGGGGGASARVAQAFCAGRASSSSTIVLFGAGGSQTGCTQAPGPQTLQQVIAPATGVLSNLAVRCGHAGSQPASGRFTVWALPSGRAMSDASSGVNTGLTVTVGNSAANANKAVFDSTHTYTYAAGDLLRIQFTTEANETLADCTASFSY